MKSIKHKVKLKLGLHWQTAEYCIMTSVAALVTFMCWSWMTLEFGSTWGRKFTFNINWTELVEIEFHSHLSQCQNYSHYLETINSGWQCHLHYEEKQYAACIVFSSNCSLELWITLLIQFFSVHRLIVTDCIVTLLFFLR